MAVLGILRIMGNHVGSAPIMAPRRAVEKGPPKSFTSQELAMFDGTKGRPIYVAVQPKPELKAVVFDVTPGSSFYGPGGAYHVFAGKNASLGLAKVNTDPASVSGPIDDLTPSERDTLFQWYEKYLQKYEIIGQLSEKL